MKTRTVPRERMVPKTIDGTTYMVKDHYDEEVPDIPPDIDSIALRVVAGALGLILCGVIVWSAISIGDLLSAIAPTWAAYMVAGVFDLSWLICTVLLYLSRYDVRRAELPSRLGWGFLAVSMVLITLHGYQSGSLAVGIAGALVAAVAKTLLVAVMKHIELPMDDRTRQWVETDMSESGALLAVADSRRKADRVRARTRDLSAALALSEEPDTEWDVSRTDRAPAVRSAKTDGRTTLSVRVRELNEVSSRPSGPPSISGRALDMMSSGMSGSDTRVALYSEFGQDTNKEAVDKAIYRAKKRLAS